MAKKQKFTEEGMFKILSEARGALKKKTNGTVNIKYDDDTSRYSKFLKTLPDNLRNTDIKNYNLYGMWEAAGKPSSFEDVQNTEIFPLQEDGTYHGFSVGNDGMFLKSKTHPSAWQEYMVSQLNPELYNNYTVKVNPEGYFGENQLQYQPNTPETWEENIRSVEEQIGNPSQWTMDDYNRLQNKLNEYKNWRENTEKGRAIIDSHNEPNEYVIPLPNHLLNKFVEGGSNTSCEEGYYWNPDTKSCEPIKGYKDLNEDQKFLINMANSPLFEERYTRMIGNQPIPYANDKKSYNLDYPADMFKRDMINNIATVKYASKGEGDFDPEHYKDKIFPAAYYLPKSKKEIDFINDYVDIFDKNSSRFQKWLLKDDIDYIENQKKELEDRTHKIYTSKDENRPYTRVHETKHASTEGMLNTDYDYKANVNNPFGFDFKNYEHFKKYYSEPIMNKYLSNSEEVSARKSEIEKAALDNGWWNPIKENFTKKHYDLLLEKLRKGKNSNESKPTDAMKDLLMNYTEDEVIKIFNDIVSNNPKDNSSMAKFGGAFYNNPLEKFILGGNKPPTKTKTKAKVNKPSLDLKMELKTMPSETIQSVIPASLKNLPKSIKEIEKREVEKQKIEKKALEEVARTGVIPDYAPENVKLYYTVEPTSYYDFSNAKRYIKNIARNPENTTMLAADEDAWKKYLGLMDDSENIRKSTARPSKGKSDGQYYKLSEEIEDKLFYEIMDKLRNQKDTSFVVNEYDVTNKVEDMETGVTPYSALGNFTIGRATDPISNKPYVSYYDKYDFDSAPWFIREKLERSGTPYEFYNRFYPPTLKTPLGKSVEFGDDMYWNVYQKKREEEEKERRRIIENDDYIIENDDYKTGGEKDKKGTNEEPIMLPEVTITPQTRQQMQFADAYKNMPEDVKKAIAYDIENPDTLSPAQEEQSYLGRGFDAITHPFTALNELHNRRGLGSNWLELNQAQNGPNFMDWSLYGAAAARLAPFVAGRLLPNVFNYNLGSLVGTQIPGATLGNALASEMIVNSALRETGLKGEQDPSTVREWEKYSEGSQDLATTLANTGMNALDALAYGELKPFKSQLVKDLKRYKTIETPNYIPVEPTIPSTPEPWQMQEMPGLHIKATMKGSPLEKNISKTGEINVKNIEAYINKSDTPLTEKHYLQKVLNQNFAGQSKIDYNTFRKAVSEELISLDKTIIPNYSFSNYGVDRLGYPNPKISNIEKSINFAKQSVDDFKKYIKMYEGYSSDIKKYREDFPYDINMTRTDKELKSHIESTLDDYKSRLSEAQNNLVANEALLKNAPLENETFIFSNREKFGRGDNKHFDDPATLGHTRTLVSKEEPDVMHILESQSDFYQNNGMTSFEKLKAEPINQKFMLEKRTQQLKNLEKTISEDETLLRDYEERFSKNLPDKDGDIIHPSQIEMQKKIIADRKQHLILKKGELQNWEQKFHLGKGHQERFLQENVQYAAEKGMNKVRVPDATTAARIQGYEGKRMWNINYKNGDKVTLNDGTEGVIVDDTFANSVTVDINGKKINIDMSNRRYDILKNSNLPVKKINDEDLKEILTYSKEHQTILKKYDEQPKLIKKLFGKEPKKITDSKGNIWYEFDIPESFRQGKAEFKAFKFGGNISNLQKFIK